MTVLLNAMSHAMASHHVIRPGKQRNPWVVAGLSLATLGLYSIYWWYTVNRELRDLGRSRGEPELEKEPLVSALAFLLGGWLMVPLVWTTVTTGSRIRVAQGLVGIRARLQVWIPVVLIVDSLAVQFVPAGGAGALAAVLGATLAFRTAALTYMQSFLNEVWALQQLDDTRTAPALAPIPAGAPLQV